MTKFILHGGSSTSFIAKESFLREIFEGIYNSQVLIVPFARDINEWEELLKKYEIRYSPEKIGIKANFILAKAEPKLFKEQISNSKIILICGGSEVLIKKYKDCFENLDLENKVVLGTSAGTNILSKVYYSNDRINVENGLNFLNIKTICHFSKEKEGRLLSLINAEDKELPVLAIPENEYTVIYK